MAFHCELEWVRNKVDDDLFDPLRVRTVLLLENVVASLDSKFNFAFLTLELENRIYFINNFFEFEFFNIEFEPVCVKFCEIQNVLDEVQLQLRRDASDRYHFVQCRVELFSRRSRWVKGSQFLLQTLDRHVDDLQRVDEGVQRSPELVSCWSKHKLLSLVLGLHFFDFPDLRRVDEHVHERWRIVSPQHLNRLDIEYLTLAVLLVVVWLHIDVYRLSSDFNDVLNRLLVFELTINEHHFLASKKLIERQTVFRFERVRVVFLMHDVDLRAADVVWLFRVCIAEVVFDEVVCELDDDWIRNLIRSSNNDAFRERL